MRTDPLPIPAQAKLGVSLARPEIPSQRLFTLLQRELMHLAVEAVEERVPAPRDVPRAHELGVEIRSGSEIRRRAAVDIIGPPKPNFTCQVARRREQKTFFGWPG